MNRQSVLDSKVTVMRGGMLIGTATVISTDPSTGDPKTIKATYSFDTPSGGWQSTDGTSTLTPSGRPDP